MHISKKANLDGRNVSKNFYDLKLNLLLELLIEGI